MSSATSIDGEVRLKADATPDSRSVHLQVDQTDPDQKAEQGFRPSHFFVLASLLAATAAVVMSRQASPEHLIFVSLVVGAAGLAAAGFYRTILPLVGEEVFLAKEPLSLRERAALEREKMLALRAIKELEFDKAMGKLSDRDFEEMAGRLRARALMLMKQLDDEQVSYREMIDREVGARLARRPAAPHRGPAEAACTCGTPNDTDAVFCKRCGARLTRASAGGAR